WAHRWLYTSYQTLKNYYSPRSHYEYRTDGGIQRRRYCRRADDHGAWPNGAHGHRPHRLAIPGAATTDLYPEFHIRRYLLEQPSSPVATGRTGQRPGVVGQSAFIVLADPDSADHGLDEGKCDGRPAHGNLRRRPATGRVCLLCAGALFDQSTRWQ